MLKRLSILCALFAGSVAFATEQNRSTFDMLMQNEEMASRCRLCSDAELNDMRSFLDELDAINQRAIQDAQSSAANHPQGVAQLATLVDADAFGFSFNIIPLKNGPAEQADQDATPVTQ